MGRVVLRGQWLDVSCVQYSSISLPTFEYHAYASEMLIIASTSEYVSQSPFRKSKRQAHTK